ncbi:3-phosphoserine/phosphohydroxythreonine transaminase [Alkalihalobacillus hwajinpoensis]|uniref:3-phosphoserine/phosphohydroxythreonine transaminase n=1 Tax=Guptibacillus hwajinpoensis TaxID=208199 RepID=UPI00188443A3|nr:3-phosphoserine/phosphohydroxythreonine transaminase [Pseudalkalibacillus hwajinpoensis]MBF0706886.1 3-phosphoserine/phosphohydroxythreonine transaminase [Pseudalkalibacillus hwajinpoensis]
MERRYNFNAGPSALPQDVLNHAQAELLNYQQQGMSIMEFSHRSKEYQKIHDGANELLRELLHIPDDYEVLFLQGGASLQFSMIPMNFLQTGQQGNYFLTGSWSQKALKEAQKIGDTYVGGSSEQDDFKRIPELDTLQYSNKDAYVHLTSNNTIHGTQWKEFPKHTHSPIVADMSSDILSRSLPIDQFGLIYAGAQKNLGPAGVTVVILKKDMLKNIPDQLPTMLDYRTHVDKKSLYNTPPSFAIYMLSLVLEWTKTKGGIKEIEKMNAEKTKLLYDTIDSSKGFYSGTAETASRSSMNVTFNLPGKELEELFLHEAAEEGFVGLKGHRSVGGCRASIYNAVPLESVRALSDFMQTFHHKHNI